MRRDARRRTENKKWWEDKKIILSGSIISFTIALVIGVALYSNDNRYNSYKNIANPDQIISIAPENEIDNETSETSTSVGKSVEESQNENKNTTEEVKQNTNNVNNVSNNNTNDTKTTTNTTSKKKTAAVNSNATENKQIEFAWPVKGEILKAFSVDSLLYSSTLQEWTVHNGIDIKADKTSVVGAAADGVVKSIKNDPRYGLTVILEHANGYKSVYSNLLTAEFVIEGEKIHQGQTIGTVGNTANFEVTDEPHLHFEMLKDGEYVDPTLYLK